MHHERDNANQVLLENARAMSRQHEQEVAAWDGIVKHQLGKALQCLPGYIPFIGSHYFDERIRGRRILTYALSQNIRPDSDFAIEWAKDWHHSSGGEALDRQNLCYKEYGTIAIHPFDSGHLPILCGLARWLSCPEASTAKGSIYEEVAATNLSKYSFRSPENMTCDSGMSLRRSYEWYSAREIAVLQPDVILCAGNQVASVFAEMLGGTKALLLKVPFPSTRVINIHYRKTNPTQKQVSELRRMFSSADLNRKVVTAGRRLGDVLERDSSFFWPVLERMRACFVEAGRK